jgi:heptose I phosphotransferase
LDQIEKTWKTDSNLNGDVRWLFLLVSIKFAIQVRPDVNKTLSVEPRTSKDGRLTRFELETWDSGRLIVNHKYAELLRRHDWLTFSTIWSRTADAAIAKKLRTDRITLKFTLEDEGVQRPFYIKRHGRSSLKEYLKPLFRLTWPILGARNEWNAIIDFHRIGIPTMVPVAVGQSGSDSFLITESLENCDKLSNILTDSRDSTVPHLSLRQISVTVANLARTMHNSGLHHQDFYLGHLMQSQTTPETIYIIDLGRVQKQTPLSQRWIIKDLAQLNFSASKVPLFERLRFLREYLGRPLTDKDRPLMARIQAKTNAISRHSRKNRL